MSRESFPPPPPLPAVPAAIEPPRVPEAVGPFLIAKLRAQQVRLEATETRVLATGDEEAVHDLRVALRRMRTLLEVGRPVFGRFYADQVREAFSDVQRATGALRDEEVLLELLASRDLAAADSPRTTMPTWLTVRRRRERALRSVVRRVVRAGELRRALRLLDALLAFAIKPSREKRAVKFARRAVDGAVREVARRRDASTDDAPALHRLRIAYKRLRYTAETFADAPGGSVAAATAQTAARFQSLLGRIHDADIAIAAVRRARALANADRDALLHALADFRAARIAAYEKAAQEPPPLPPTTI